MVNSKFYKFPLTLKGQTLSFLPSSLTSKYSNKLSEQEIKQIFFKKYILLHYQLILGIYMIIDQNKKKTAKITQGVPAFKLSKQFVIV